MRRQRRGGAQAAVRQISRRAGCRFVPADRVRAHGAAVNSASTRTEARLKRSTTCSTSGIGPGFSGAGADPRDLCSGQGQVHIQPVFPGPLRPRAHRGSGRPAVARLRGPERRGHRGRRRPAVRSLRSRATAPSPSVPRWATATRSRALGVAAHEAGHAMQHAAGYAPFRFRGALVPVANIGSNLGFVLFFIGLFFFRGGPLMTVGILLYLGGRALHPGHAAGGIERLPAGDGRALQQEHPGRRRINGGKEGPERRRPHVRGGRPHGRPAADHGSILISR